MASTIDTSGIDETKPVHGTPTTQSVRDNFAAIKTQLDNAKFDIDALSPYGSAEWVEAVQDVVGGMVSTNTESGIAVTYDDVNGKLDFDVSDPTITLSGDVSGAGTITNLGDVTITTTVADDSHNHTSATITDFTEAAQDAVGAALTDTASINLTYTDATNQITADAIFGTTAGTVAEGTAPAAAIVAHEADTTAHPASSIVNTPAGGISSTNVQTAINELDTEKAPKANPTLTGVTTIDQIRHGQSINVRSYAGSHAPGTYIPVDAIVEMGRFTFGGNSQNVVVEGEVLLNSGTTTGLCRFIVECRSNTLPSISVQVTQKKRDLGYDVSTEAYIDSTTNTVIVAYKNTSGLGSIHQASWTLNVHERGSYNYWVGTGSTYTPITDFTGLTTVTATDYVDADLTSHLTDTTDAHDASAISILDSGAYFVSTNAEGALAELATGLAIQRRSVVLTGTYVLQSDVPSWAKKIVVTFSGASTSGTSAPIVQLGTGSGIVTTGYTGACQNATSWTDGTAFSSGFVLTANGSASNTLYGSIEISGFADATNAYVVSGNIYHGGTSVNSVAGGVALGGTLTQIKITTVGGTDTFDAGLVNILYM